MSRVVGWGSAVGIATGYCLDGRGIESRWGKGFPHRALQACHYVQPDRYTNFYNARRVNLNHLKTKRNLLYVRNQSVPRSKHFPPRL